MNNKYKLSSFAAAALLTSCANLNGPSHSIEESLSDEPITFGQSELSSDNQQKPATGSAASESSQSSVVDAHFNNELIIVGPKMFPKRYPNKVSCNQNNALVDKFMQTQQLSLIDKGLFYKDEYDQRELSVLDIYRMQEDRKEKLEALFECRDDESELSNAISMLYRNANEAQVNKVFLSLLSQRQEQVDELYPLSTLSEHVVDHITRRTANKGDAFDLNTYLVSFQESLHDDERTLRSWIFKADLLDLVGEHQESAQYLRKVDFMLNRAGAKAMSDVIQEQKTKPKHLEI